MRTLVILLLTAASALAAPAAAQDAQESPPPVFTGFRVEGVVGWDHTQILDDDEGALLYGVGVGYDFQTGRAVLGIEAEATESNNNGCLSNLLTPGDRYCSDTGRNLYIGARAGLLVSRNILLFAKGGYVNSRLTTEYDPGGAAAVTAAQFNLDGLRLGGGVEVAIGRRAFIRGEARYTTYDDGGDRGALLGAFGFRF